MSRRPGVSASLSILLLALLGSPAGSTRASGRDEPAPPLRLVAGPRCEKGERALEVASIELAGVEIVAKPLPVAEWEARMEREAPGMGQSLRQNDGGPAPFQVFLLSLSNRSREKLQFQPGNVVRIMDRKREDHPVDYTDLYRFLAEQGKKPEAVDLIKNVFFDSSLTLEPQQTAERLLIFKEPGPKECKKSLSLLVSNFQVGTETYGAVLPFHVEKARN
jgi:hypothetical protein